MICIHCLISNVYSKLPRGRGGEGQGVRGGALSKCLQEVRSSTAFPIKTRFARQTGEIKVKTLNNNSNNRVTDRSFYGERQVCIFHDQAKATSIKSTVIPYTNLSSTSVHWGRKSAFSVNVRKSHGEPGMGGGGGRGGMGRISQASNTYRAQ